LEIKFDNLKDESVFLIPEIVDKIIIFNFSKLVDEIVNLCLRNVIYANFTSRNLTFYSKILKIL